MTFIIYLLILKILTEVSLIYNVLITDIQQSDSVIHTYTFFFSIGVLLLYNAVLSEKAGLNSTFKKPRSWYLAPLLHGK